MHNSDTTLEKPTVQDKIEKLQEIQPGFRQNLSNLHQKLELLSSRFDLQSSLDILKNKYQKRACDLEAEVKRLSEDLDSIRRFFGLNFNKCDSGKR